MKPEIIIDGHWLSGIMPWGDLEWTTCWPGGTESITFGVARSHRLFRPDAIVELDYGGDRIARGAIVDPTRGEPLTAEGLWRKGEDFAALNASGDVAASVHEAVEQAIARGLPWLAGFGDGSSPYDLSPVPLVDGVPKLDLDQPHSVAQYLDASAQQRGHQWGVRADGYVIMTGWESPALHMLPGVDGLGVTREGYASTLNARYVNSTSGLYTTITRHDYAAIERWGYAERTLTEPLGESVPMSHVDAAALLDGLLTQGRSQIGWTAPIEAQFGDVVTEYGQPIDLATVYARQTTRLHGLTEDVADLAGQTWVDVPIARTRHKDGAATIEPRGLSSPMNDALAGVSA